MSLSLVGEVGQIEEGRDRAEALCPRPCVVAVKMVRREAMARDLGEDP